MGILFKKLLTGGPGGPGKPITYSPMSSIKVSEDAKKKFAGFAASGEMTRDDKSIFLKDYGDFKVPKGDTLISNLEGLNTDKNYILGLQGSGTVTLGDPKNDTDTTFTLDEGSVNRVALGTRFKTPTGKLPIRIIANPKAKANVRAVLHMPKTNK